MSEEEAARREAQVAADQTWDSFKQLGTRLDELSREFGDEGAREAYREVEDLVSDLDDALAQAQEAIGDV